MEMSLSMWFRIPYPLLLFRRGRRRWRRWRGRGGREGGGGRGGGREGQLWKMEEQEAAHAHTGSSHDEENQ